MQRWKLRYRKCAAVFIHLLIISMYLRRGHALPAVPSMMKATAFVKHAGHSLGKSAVHAEVLISTVRNSVIHAVNAFKIIVLLQFILTTGKQAIILVIVLF